MRNLPYYITLGRTVWFPSPLDARTIESGIITEIDAPSGHVRVTCGFGSAGVAIKDCYLSEQACRYDVTQARDDLARIRAISEKSELAAYLYSHAVADPDINPYTKYALREKMLELFGLDLPPILSERSHT